MTKAQLKNPVGNRKVSEVLPLLIFIAKEWNLNLSFASHFKIATRILNNSIINN